MHTRKLIGILKTVIAEALYRSGILKLILRFKFRNHAAILMYHRVLPEREVVDSFSTEAIVVTPEQFDWQIQLLQQYMRPLSLTSFVDCLLSEDAPMPPGACLISFDDGWFDNQAYALPILKKHNVPAVVFVCTSYIGSNNCFWQEELARVIHEAWRKPQLGDKVFALLGAEELGNAPATDIRRRGREFITNLKKRPLVENRRLLGRVSDECRAFGIDVDNKGDDRFMSWEDVLELSRSGVVSIGSHAVTHTPLTQLTDDKLILEMTESRKEIESRLGLRVDTLAYPNGDFNSAVVASARNAGYRIAVTTVEGKVAKNDDPLRLKRINIHKSGTATPARFLCRLAGLL
jgi:peptidoglycan/xylan/chitin deacetylase (PgdA/CDA1 family)